MPIASPSTGSATPWRPSKRWTIATRISSRERRSPMPPRPDPLIPLLQSPRRLTGLRPQDWYPALTLARRIGLLGTLAAQAETAEVLELVPVAAQDALVGGRRLGDHHDGMLRWETEDRKSTRLNSSH